MSSDRWNRLADHFEDAVCDITANDSNRVMQHLVSKVQHDSCGTLVDLGCGIGTFILKFGSRYKEVIGVDYSPRMLARAQTRCSKMSQVHWIYGSIGKAVSIIGAKSDLTICLNVITSPSLAYRRLQWKAVRKVTKPAGFALVGVPALESATMVARLNAHNHSARGQFTKLGSGLVYAVDEYQKYYSHAELRNEMERQGFVVRAVRKITYSWAEEGLLIPRAKNAPRPWDWVCLAQLHDCGRRH